jgi:ABC-type dipeptide/oligopeptide/nickel transport system permease component
MHIKKGKKFVFLIPVLLVVLLVIFMGMPIIGSSTVTKDYGEPVEVKKGISVPTELNDKVTDEELSDLTDEYGTEANIIINDVGY